MIVDRAWYEDGRRVETLHSEQAFEWIGLHEPTPQEFSELADRLHLHPLAVEDAVNAHQRPKAERYPDGWFMVVKTAEYVDSVEVVRLAEISMFIGSTYIVTVRHGDACSLAGVRAHLEANPDRLAMGPMSVAHAVIDHVVDVYERVVADVDLDIDQIQAEVFSGDRRNHAQRIFKLKREVLDFRHAVRPMADAVDAICNGMSPAHGPRPDAHLAAAFRDVLDHLSRVNDRLTVHDAVLTDALSANGAAVGMRQNEDMRKISAWVAIVSVPTMIAGIYGMNFEHMPELGSRAAYPIVLAVMAVSCVALYRTFKRRDWL